MEYPIVGVTTKDNIKLKGMLLGSSKTRLYLNIPGTASNFYYNSNWLESLAKKLDLAGWAMLNTNNRGSEVFDCYKNAPLLGAANEIFEESLIDIDAWIKFALDKGFKQIVLSGHSLGSEKIVYYMNYGEYRNTIIAVVLLGFSDSFGTNELYIKRIGHDYLAEAQKLIDEGKPEQLLYDLYAHGGYLPQTARSYFNFFNHDSELAKALPLRKGQDLKLYQQIKVPILGIIGETGEFTIIQISEAVELLKRENSQAKVYQILGCNHEYEGKEVEMSNIINKFLQENIK